MFIKCKQLEYLTNTKSNKTVYSITCGWLSWFERRCRLCSWCICHRLAICRLFCNVTIIQTNCIILDLKKAFDTVPNQHPLYKLRFYIIRDNILKWINHWLTSQMQMVLVDGSKSPKVRVRSGIPQGTVLGLRIILIIYKW